MEIAHKKKLRTERRTELHNRDNITILIGILLREETEN